MKLLLSLLFVLSFFAIRPAEAVAVNWVDSKRLEDKAYFLHNAAPRIEIYDLTNETWLEALNLPQIPTAFHVDADFIYVVFHTSVYRYDHDGENEVHLLNVSQPVHAVFSDDDHLFVFYTVGVQVIHRITAVKIADAGTGHRLTYVRTGVSHNPERNRFYGRSTGVSPSDIGQLVYDDAGNILSITDSPHHADYAGATQTWAWPDGSKVTDSSGNVYDGTTLRHQLSFASQIDDLAFRGSDLPVVLHGSTIKAYSDTVLQTGFFDTMLPVQTIYTRVSDVAAFYPDDTKANGINVLFVPYEDLKPTLPGEPIDPVDLEFTPDSAFIDTENILYLLAAQLQSLFRWDIIDQVWLPTIPLHDAPAFVTYSDSNHAIYLAYPSGSIFQIDLNESSFSEVPFANLATRPRGLIAAGEYIIGADDSGGRVSHTSFAPDGSKIDYKDLNYHLNNAAWNPISRRIYNAPDQYLRSSSIDGDGTFGPLKTSYQSGLGNTYPLRVKPDGSIIVIGSGRIFDATSLEQINSLPTEVTDVTWIGDTMFGLNGNDLVQYTLPTYGTGPTLKLSDTPSALLTTRDDDLLLITIGQDGVPHIDVRNSTFSIVPPAVLAQPQRLRAVIESAQAVSLFWADISGEEEYRIERRKNHDADWALIQTIGANVKTYRDNSVEAGETYHYRVIASNGELVSEPSEIVTVVLSRPDAPDDFTATVLSSSAIRLEWSRSDRADEYHLERRPDGASTWTTIGRFPGDNLSYTDDGAIPGTRYDYRLTAYNGLGGSDWKTVSAETPMVAPGTPVLLPPSVVADSVTLRWNGVPFAAEFVVERSLSDTPNSSWEEVGVVASPATIFTDHSVKPLTNYHYRIKARNSAGESDYSAMRSVMIPALPTPPRPHLKAPHPETSTSLLLTWEPSAYTSGYRLEYRSEYEIEWTLLAELPAKTHEYLHTGLETGRLYNYRIQAWNDSGVSTSPVVWGTPLELVSLLQDNFEPTENFRMWYRINGGKVVNGGPGFDTGAALWFDGSAGTAFAETMAVDVRQGGYLYFHLRAGNQEDGATYWKRFPPIAMVAVQYSTNGSTWQPLQTINITYPNFQSWEAHTLTLPSEARSATTRLRWILVSGSGGNWAIDNVEFRGPKPPPVPWVDYVQTSALSATTVILQWPSPSPANILEPFHPDGAYLFRVERQRAGGPWKTVGLVDGSLFPIFVDYEAPAASTLFYRIQTLTPWEDGPPSLASMVTTGSQLDQWRLSNFGTTDNVGPFADTSVDKFGLANLQRYAFGLEVGQPPATYTGDERQPGLPLVWVDSITNKLTVLFQRRMPATFPEVEYIVEFSDDLIHWMPQPNPVASRMIRGNWEEVRFEQPSASYMNGSCFARVRVIRR